MIALYPGRKTAKALALPGGEPAAELHVTVAYTGKADQIDPQLLLAAAGRVLGRGPITATISGHGRFTGGPDGDVIVALVDSPQLEQLRRDLIDALTAEGVTLSTEHGFTAHCTLRYIDPATASPFDRLQPRQVTFKRLSVVHGNNRTDLPLTGDVKALAREAYAQGWAASGGPMTDRVRAGCVAAMELAEANPDHPHLLEATLHLGHLEGVWAKIFARRDQLHDDIRNKVWALWVPLVRRLDLPAMVRSVRRAAGLQEATPDPNPVDPDLILAVLRNLTQQYGWDGLQAEVRDAIAAAMAEGVADALGLAGQQINLLGLSFNLAFEDAYKAYRDSATLAGEADSWLAQILGDQANVLGRQLGALARDGAAYEEMLAAAEETLTTQRATSAVSVALDQLASRAMSQGAVTLYQSEGVQFADFLTAGDARVCPKCSALEKANPYPLGSVPLAGVHPYCRCVIAATTALPASLLHRFLGSDQEGVAAIRAAIRAQRVEDDAAALGAGRAGAGLGGAHAPANHLSAGAGDVTPTDRAAQRAAARERHRVIAQATGNAKLLAHTDELLAKNATLKVIQQSLDPALIKAEQLFANADPAVLTALRNAADTGDLTELRAAIARASADAGIKPIEKAGAKVAFNSELHEGVGGVAIEPGADVVVVRPGATVTLSDGSVLQLAKAQVTLVRAADPEG